MDHDSDPYWDALVTERFPRVKRMSNDVLDRIDKYKDAPGVYFHIRETLEKSRDEILRLRAALAAERERCAKVADAEASDGDSDPDNIDHEDRAWTACSQKIAAAIRALPETEPQS